MKPEEIKNARKLAYQNSKAAHDANPTYQALKEKQKEKLDSYEQRCSAKKGVRASLN